MTSLKTLLPQHLQTSRLTLELFDYSKSHYACLLASMNSSTAHRNMGDFGIRTPEDFDKLNSSTRLAASLFANSVKIDTDIYYLARIKDSEAPLIGGVSACQRNSKVPPDMGWCFLEQYHGQGYATEAAAALIQLLRDQLGITEVVAWPGIHNLPSINVARRVGFVEGPPLKDDSGGENCVFILPGMKLDDNITLSLYGEST